MGTDFHGQSVTKAAQKAVRDAVSRSCLCGLEEILGYSFEEMNEKVVLKVTVAVTRPEEVDVKQLEQFLPVGKKEFTIVEGGLMIKGLNISEFGDMDDSIEASIVCIEVCISE
jgi:uncharacterized protein (TIGR02058 family)